MTPSRSTARVVGVDIARFVALAGMMATHILPAFEDGSADLTLSQSLAGGRASALFAVLAGASLALTTGRTTPVRGREFVAAAAGVAVRAVLIAAIGLALGGFDSGIAVILGYYGVLFLLGIPFLVLRTPWLLVLAAGWLVLGPVVAHLVRPRLPPPGFDASPSFEALGEPARLLGELTFTGHYPAMPWLAYLLVGMAIGRTDLTRWRTSAILASAGAVMVAVAVLVSDALVARPGVRAQLLESAGPPEFLDRMLVRGFPGTTPTDTWWWLAVRAPHTATPFDLAQTIGSALLVIALCLVIGRLLPSVSAVVFGAGAMTLTLYTAHVLLRVQLWDDDTPSTYVGHLGAALAIGVVFALTQTRGPVEALVGGVSNLARRWIPPRSDAVRPRADDRQRPARDRPLPGDRPSAPVSERRGLRCRRHDA
ncbi:MAG: heparan-alpha-glucosaminide N-acetyltransferase domain-containing protein, partial [Marmoricola sp.]